MKKYNLFIAFSLVFALFIYAFYRVDKTVINELLGLVISANNYLELKTYFHRVLSFPDWAIYSLPGALWVGAVTLVSKNFFVPMGVHKINLGLLPLLFAIGLEFFQLLGITDGTFDVLDILSVILAWSLAFFLVKSPYAFSNVLKELNFRSVSLLFAYAIVYLSDIWVG